MLYRCHFQACGKPVLGVAAVTLLVPEGQGRVRDALETWPLSLRLRLSARLRRAQRDESDRQIAGKATRWRQSHE
jgi:hypothetical protein